MLIACDFNVKWLIWVNSGFNVTAENVQQLS